MHIARIIKGKIIIIIDKNSPTDWKSLSCSKCNVLKLCTQNSTIKVSDKIISEILFPCIYFNAHITSRILKVIISNYYKLNL